MDLQHTKRALAAAWIVGAGIIGLSVNVSSPAAAVVFAVLGFGPPLIMLLLWNEPPETMTESIRQARR